MSRYQVALALALLVSACGGESNQQAASTTGSGGAGGGSPSGGGGTCRRMPDPRDPDDTSSWGPIAPSLVVHGASPAAVKLADGRVLLTGGERSDAQGCNYALASAEIYDPATDTWTAAAHMPRPRYLHRATLLSDARVVVGGGLLDDTPTFAESLWIYDPMANTWSVAAKNQLSSGIPLMQLPSGRIFTTGYQAPQLYDPVSDTWTTAAAPANPNLLSPLLSTRLLNGDILLAGPSSELGKSAERYHEGTDSWAPAGKTNSALHYGLIATIADGRAVAPGPTTDVYDPDANDWASGGPSDPCRASSTASVTALPDGRALVVSGYQADGAASVFEPAVNRWRTIDSIPDGTRLAHSAVALNDGSVLVLGGVRGGASGTCPRGSFLYPRHTNWKWTP